jgi:lysophospholipase L1-like esterase
MRYGAHMALCFTALFMGCSESHQAATTTTDSHTITDTTGATDTTVAMDTMAAPADTAAPTDTAVAPDTTTAQDTTPEPAPDTTPQPAPDTATPPDPGTPSATECFKAISGDIGPNYDQYSPIVGTHCKGTNHQEITDIERVVFLGDSVTAGTPPTMFWEYYSALLLGNLQQKFGADIEWENCAEWGARTDDLLIGKKEIAKCFPKAVDDRRTLVVMTIGGNDIASWAQDGLSAEEATVEADKAADLLEDSLKWFKEPGRFPNGVFVIVGSPYEYTDATGDVSSCPFSAFAGLEGNWIEGAGAVIHLHERYMKMAVEQQIDIAFLLEHFCGHGFHYQNPDSQCYKGPDAEIWFDLTCIHPNPKGHAVIADMFTAVVNE